MSHQPTVVVRVQGLPKQKMTPLEKGSSNSSGLPKVLFLQGGESGDLSVLCESNSKQKHRSTDTSISSHDLPNEPQQGPRSK